MTIQIVDKPHLYPQRCFFTGDATERPIIDTGVNDTEGGRVYISFSFMDDLAKEAGYATRGETSAILEANAALQRQIDILPAAIERVASAIRLASDTAIRDLLDGEPDPDSDVPEGSTPDPAGDAGDAEAYEPALDEYRRPSL